MTALLIAGASLIGSAARAQGTIASLGGQPPAGAAAPMGSRGFPDVNDILQRSLAGNATVCDGINGNFWNRVERFTNVSMDFRIRIDSVKVMAIDPTVLGFPDVENSNALQAQAAAIAAFPDFPFWGLSWWVGDDPPEVTYPFVEVFDASLSCTIGPGQSFTLETRAHNNLFSCTSSTTPSDFGELAIGYVFSGAVFDACAGSALTYGAGTPGTGGVVPVLTVKGCPVPGGTVVFHVENGLPGSHGCLFVGTSEASIRVAGGTFLVGRPLRAVMITLDHAGAAELSVTLPLDTGGQTYFLQAVHEDPGAPRGLSMSNGLRATIESDTCP